MSMRTAAIGDVATLNRKAPVLAGDNGAMVPFVPMAAVSADGGIHREELRPLTELTSGYTYFERGDVLLAKITPCFENGKVAHLDALPHGFGFGSTEFHVLTPGPAVEPRYLYHAVRTPHFRRLGASSMTGTAGQQRVPAAFVSRFRIPLPPLTEQRRLAAALDKADAVRRNRRMSMRLLDEFLRSAFLEMFGDPLRNEKRWDVVRLPEVLQTPLRNGLSPSKGGAFIASVLTLTAVTGDRFDPSAVKEGTFAGRIPEEKLVDARDFLICRGNGNRSLTGRGRFPRALAPGVVFPDTMIAARIDPSRMDPEFFEAIWATAGIRERLQGKARTTSGIYKINQGMLEATSIPSPPRAIQKRFARVVTDVRAVRARMTAPDWSRFFDSLSAHAFRTDP